MTNDSTFKGDAISRGREERMRHYDASNHEHGLLIVRKV